MSYFLSSTNTVNDVKAVMQRTYSQLGFASDELYIAAIGVVSTPVYLTVFKPIIGEGIYETIQAKNKVNLSDIEEYIYWAEVYYLAAAMCGQLGNKMLQAFEGGGSKSMSSEGYSQGNVSYSSSGRKIGYFELQKEYLNQAKEFMGLAGYAGAVATRLRRGGYFWTDPRDVLENEFRYE